MYVAEPAVSGLSRDTEKEFEVVFKKHFRGLHSYACTILRDDIMAEEIVQNVFCRLWEKSEQISIRESVSGYLYRSVYHESLNYLKHLKVREAHWQYTVHQSENDHATTNLVELDELQTQIDKALQELPEKCRTIFQMSRFEELKYQEIADRLDIPVKMVENQMGKALRLLRSKLADFLPALLIFFFLT